MNSTSMIRASMIRASMTGALAVASLVGCAGRDVPPSIGNVIWGNTPDHGVHIGSVGQCVRRCNIDAHDVIKSVDGTEVSSAKDVYIALGDGQEHTVVLWKHSLGREETVALQIDVTDMRSFGFISVEELSPLPFYARGDRVGFSIPIAQVSGTSKTWTIPNDMWGETYIIFDFSHESVLGDVFSSDMVGHIAVSLHVTMIILKVAPSADTSKASFFHEGLQAIPHVAMATTLYERVGRWGMSAYLRGLSIYTHPNLLVVDCHGIVRWHTDWTDANSLDTILLEAIQYSKFLESQRESGACWEPRIPAGEKRETGRGVKQAGESR